MVQFFFKSLNQNYTLNMSSFAFFHLNKKFAETTSINEKEYISQKPFTQPKKVLENLNLKKI